VVRSWILLCAAPTVALGSASNAQAQQQPKPIARADYVKTLDNRFSTIDANHDGKVSKEELAAEQQRELQRAKGAIVTKLQESFRRLDTNKDGQLSVQEFMAAAPPIRANESAEQMIVRVDTNHDGKISVDEFRAPELAKFNRVDANHDGVVTPAEQAAARK
jgi:Ca2+-binding EF-hand superfamily protein